VPPHIFASEKKCESLMLDAWDAVIFFKKKKRGNKYIKKGKREYRKSSEIP